MSGAKKRASEEDEGKSKGMSRAAKKRQKKKAAKEASAAPSVPAPEATAADAPGRGSSGSGGSSSSSSSSSAKGQRSSKNGPEDAMDVSDGAWIIDGQVNDASMNLDAHAIVNEDEMDSGDKARQLFQWVLAPLHVDQFYGTYWEKKAVVVKRGRPSYHDGWISTEDIREFTEARSLRYGTDIDVTNVVEGKRITLNQKGDEKEGGAPVSSDDVWTNFEQGCSVRMPCPQKYSEPLHALLAGLEEEFGSMVGSNVYLTPPAQQGFSPHWDDVDAFLLQLEGSKRWRVYRPRTLSETLPRHSSHNLEKPEELEGLQPDIDVVLERGDMLYLPRGWIHSAVTVSKTPSLHVTLSCQQANCWGDFLELLVPQALQDTVDRQVGLRRSLPSQYFGFMGVVHEDVEGGDAEGADAEGGGATSDQDSGSQSMISQRRARAEFKAKVKEYLNMVVDTALDSLDPAADSMAKRFISDRLPPVLSAGEEEHGVAGDPTPQLHAASEVRLVRRGIARLVVEDGMAIVYHCLDNARVHHAHPMRPLAFELDDAPALEMLLAAYPDYVTVGDLPHPPTEDEEDKVAITTALYKEGLLLLKT